jgi:rod shape-determining protein MreC
MNDSLLAENNRLHQQLATYAEYDYLKDTGVTLKVNPDDSTKKITYAHYIYKTARVVNNSVNNATNFITINRGSKDGIYPNMALVSSTGVVGRVLDVSDHFATALSILNTKQRLSAKLSDGTSSFAYWEQKHGANTLLMKITQADVKIKKGDSVFTTSYSTIFPADMLIGKVEKIFLIKKDNSRLLHITTATNFQNLQFIYAIKNDYIEERRLLEDSTKAKQSKLEAPKR